MVSHGNQLSKSFEINEAKACTIFSWSNQATGRCGTWISGVED